MFDNLRQQYGQPEQPQEEMQAAESAAASPMDDSPSSARLQLGAPSLLQGFTSLSPMQRFILALMLFLNVTVLGCFALLAFERVSLPF